MNSSFPLFTDITQNNIVNKQKGELYMQLYPYMSEDFFSTADSNIYSLELKEWMLSVDEQLKTLMELLSKHTHSIPPHSHPGGQGSPIPLITIQPDVSPAIRWTAAPKPSINNTTGSVSNYTGNFSIVGIPSEGSAVLGLRRAKQLPITLTTTLPPVLTDSL